MGGAVIGAGFLEASVEHYLQSLPSLLQIQPQVTADNVGGATRHTLGHSCRSPSPRSARPGNGREGWKRMVSVLRCNVTHQTKKREQQPMTRFFFLYLE